ncbi:ribbon-helix-helix domain-containing protein [Maribacter sp. 2307UL18-2]|uniref:ribbon-helix-helix domain-containing protein n=1 Tax=Maribacter sp. 2307UL18-2 TaxID=3386274 RepID=UPI0039BCCB30
MAEKKDIESYEEKLQKLREEIEKGWNSGESNRTVQDIIASKRRSRNKKELAMENKILSKENKGFHLFSTSMVPTPMFTGKRKYCIGK